MFFHRVEALCLQCAIIVGVFTPRIWKELFRHSRLDDSVSGIITILAEELGISGIAIRVLDLKQATWTTVAQACVGTWNHVPPAHSKCTAKQVQQILSWVRSREVLTGQSKSSALLGTIIGANVTADVAVGPLANEEDDAPVGALILLGEPGSMTERHVKEAARLIEPFQVALAASRRIQELARLREMFEAENRTLLSKLNRQEVVGTIVGADAGFKEVMDRVEQVATADVPVLLLGETGTGKEVVARELHTRSRRNQGPMLRVNCGAIPPGLVDSELFGHERGSFTGAVAARAGWFERADGGTLFLDEIGELPLAAQVRLLRVLQEGRLERVGGQHSITVDVRIVAATHQSLTEMVAAGTFRKDLWYRISVFPIRLPPLKERQSDIPALAAHFAWHAGVRLGGQPLAVTNADLDMLTSYDWPGNVRELAAVIERAAILGNGCFLDMRSALGAAEKMDSVRPKDNGEFPSLDATIRRHIEGALRRTSGQIEGAAGAAKLLGLNPHTLRAKMRKLGIDWGAFRSG
jgi:transcriptional regulator with GAF, ATPase, and Fis domain